MVRHRGQFLFPLLLPNHHKKYKTLSPVINSLFCFFLTVYHTYPDQHRGGDKQEVRADSNKSKTQPVGRVGLGKKKRKQTGRKSFLEVKANKYPKVLSVWKGKTLSFFFYVTWLNYQNEKKNKNKKKSNPNNKVHHAWPMPWHVSAPVDQPGIIM